MSSFINKLLPILSIKIECYHYKFMFEFLYFFIKFLLNIKLFFCISFKKKVYSFILDIYVFFLFNYCFLLSSYKNILNISLNTSVYSTCFLLKRTFFFHNFKLIKSTNIYISYFLNFICKYYVFFNFYNFVFLPKKLIKITVLKSPHINKRSREQFELKSYRTSFNIKVYNNILLYFLHKVYMLPLKLAFYIKTINKV